MDQVGFGMRATSFFFFQIKKNGIIIAFLPSLSSPPHCPSNSWPLSLLIVIVCIYVPVNFFWEVSFANTVSCTKKKLINVCKSDPKRGSRKAVLFLETTFLQEESHSTAENGHKR